MTPSALFLASEIVNSRKRNDEQEMQDGMWNCRSSVQLIWWFQFPSQSNFFFGQSSQVNWMVIVLSYSLTWKSLFCIRDRYTLHICILVEGINQPSKQEDVCKNRYLLAPVSSSSFFLYAGTPVHKSFFSVTHYGNAKMTIYRIKDSFNNQNCKS